VLLQFDRVDVHWASLRRVSDGYPASAHSNTISSAARGVRALGKG
jgi:hypothetical protein